MTQKDLITKVAESTGNTKKATTEVYQSIFGIISEEVSNGGSLLVPGFGRFTTKLRKARKGSNPGTGEKVDIPAKFVPSMSFAQDLKDDVSKLPIE